MTPVEAIDRDLAITSLHWRVAVRIENREVESACMRHINDLLEQRFVYARRSKP